MSIQVASLYALVSVAGADQSVRDLQRVSGAVNKGIGSMRSINAHAGQIGKGVGQVAGGLVRVGEIAAIAVATAGVAAVKAGMTFQQQMELIHTQAGASQDEVIGRMRDVQALVAQVGVGPEELARGLYHIESVGLRGAKAMDVLRASALGAKVGLADMESVTNALTAVVYSGITGAKSMTDAMAILDGIVGVGNMHLQDLTDSFRSGILGTAATYGVDIRSLGAAIATLTDAGVPAQIASTRLNNTLTHMAAPTKAAIDVLKSLKIGQFDLAKALRSPDGIDGALRLLGKHLQDVGEMSASGKLTPKGAADLSKIFGGSRFGATAMQLLTNAMAAGGDRIAQKYDLITKRSQTFGENVKATMATAGFQWSAFTANVQEAAIAFSDGVLPAIARVGVAVNKILVSHTGDFRRFGVEVGQAIDKINWTQVEDGAKAFLGVMRTIADVASAIPPEVDAAVVALLGVNKLSGGLFGKGAANIVGGTVGLGGDILGMAVRGLGGRVGGRAGSLLGQVGATPVYITGIAPGVGLGGALGGGVPGAAAGGGLLGTISKVLGGVFAVTVAAAIAEEVHNAIAPGGGLQNRMQTGQQIPTDQMSWPWGPRNTPDLNLGPLQHILGGDSTFNTGGSTHVGGSLYPKLGPPAPGSTGDTHSESRSIELASIAATKANTAALHASKAAIAAHAKATLASMLAGIHARSAAHYGGTGLGQSAVTATLFRNMAGTERSILRSHQSTERKIEHLRQLEAIAVAAKDWGLKRSIANDIARLGNVKVAPINIDGREIAQVVLKYNTGRKS